MKRWLITGASSGFGRLLAERVAANGDHVIAVARREDRLRELAADHDSVTPLVADLTAPDVVQRLQTAMDAAGGLDILVNNGRRLLQGFRGPAARSFRTTIQRRRSHPDCRRRR
jgi:short-subunit dehydrogenase